VSCGGNYRSLTKIVDARWELTADSIELSDPRVVACGTWLRLGHMKDGKPVYSDGWNGTHQPFESPRGNFHTFEGRLYRDRKPLIAEWPEYKEWGNAWVDGNLVYFEALPAGGHAPEDWELWTYDLDTDEKQFLLPGANPCVFDGKLYYCTWDSWRFLYAIRD
jgi:hypothetical protein